MIKKSKRLKFFCDKLDSNEYQWVLSNSDPKNIEPDNNFFDILYKKYEIERVLARRSINSNGTRRGYLNELIISNVGM